MAQIPVVPGQGLGLPPEVVAAMLQQQGQQGPGIPLVPGTTAGSPGFAVGGQFDPAQLMAAMQLMQQGAGAGAQGAGAGAMAGVPGTQLPGAMTGGSPQTVGTPPSPVGSTEDTAAGQLEEAGINNIRAYLQKIFSPEGLTALGLIQGAYKPTMPWESPVSNMIGGAISGYSAGVSSEAAAAKAGLEKRETEANIELTEQKIKEAAEKMRKVKFTPEQWQDFTESLPPELSATMPFWTTPNEDGTVSLSQGGATQLTDLWQAILTKPKGYRPIEEEAYLRRSQGAAQALASALPLILMQQGEDLDAESIGALIRDTLTAVQGPPPGGGAPDPGNALAAFLSTLTEEDAAWLLKTLEERAKSQRGEGGEGGEEPKTPVGQSEAAAREAVRNYVQLSQAGLPSVETSLANDPLFRAIGAVKGGLGEIFSAFGSGEKK